MRNIKLTHVLECEYNCEKNTASKLKAMRTNNKKIRILLMPLLLACYLIIFPQNIWILLGTFNRL